MSLQVIGIAPVALDRCHFCQASEGTSTQQDLGSFDILTNFIAHFEDLPLHRQRQLVDSLTCRDKCCSTLLSCSVLTQAQEPISYAVVREDDPF